MGRGEWLRVCPLWCCSTVETPHAPLLPASLAPLTCHGRAVLFCLSFSSTPLLPLLTEVSSLYCTVQKQNHKPISVILAMRLDGPNLSPSGAIGSTPVFLKRPLSCGQRGSFLLGDNCRRACALHVTRCDSVSPCWGMTARRPHRRPSCVACVHGDAYSKTIKE